MRRGLVIVVYVLLRPFMRRVCDDPFLICGALP
jgi:hypothetical protein